MRSISTIISKLGKTNARLSAKLIVRNDANDPSFAAPFYALWRAACHALGLHGLGMHGGMVPVTTRVTATSVTGGACCQRQQGPGRRSVMRRRARG